MFVVALVLEVTVTVIAAGQPGLPVRPVTSTGVRRSLSLLSPSRPLLFLPQHLAPPEVVKAQVWFPPAEIDATPEVRPETSTGVLLFVVVPSPSWPKEPSPQHLAPPEVVTAQVWLPPAVIDATPDVRPETSTGMLLSVVLPSPSWPPQLPPQHLAPPEDVKAQVWLSPAVIDATPDVRPETSTGVLLFVVVPSPSWPVSLLPQHLAPPEVVTAQVWKVLVVIDATPDVRPETSTGVLLVVVMPSPSWPPQLLPQHLTPPEVVTAQVWW